ncbi:hypothetical protein EHS39_29305 [Ensifer sp. MPMI2T]|nr:hypothetical protein EHS39_29305 [Ensifer sp. MPMI2T]
MSISDEQLRVATYEFLIRNLVTKTVRSCDGADLKLEICSALLRMAPPFGSNEVEQASIRARMYDEAMAVLNWAIDGEGATRSPIPGRPLPHTHYREWR